MDKQYHREYNKRRYHRIKAEYINQLGGKCVSCGSIEDLQFDHIEASTKSFEIGKLMNYAKALRDAEIKKCQLLCYPCHKLKTAEHHDDNSVEHGGGLTGKRNCYCLLCAPLKREYMRQWKRNKL